MLPKEPTKRFTCSIAIGMMVPKMLPKEPDAISGTIVDVHVEGGQLVAMPDQMQVRAGWKEAAAAIADEADRRIEDWLGFGNDGDDRLEW